MENKNHIQVLLKNNIVIAEIVFENNDPVLMAETFEQFDYDQVIDTRRKEVSLAGLGAAWNGQEFIAQPYPSWTLSENFTWEPPKPKPDSQGDYDWDWDEKNQTWIVKDNSVSYTSKFK
jgi:hypothetical protein